MCDQERACLFLIFLFSHCKDFYPYFDRPIKNFRLFHGVQPLTIYHLRATSNSSRFIWIKKLNYLFKLIVNPSLHLLCFLTSSLGRRWFPPISIFDPPSCTPCVSLVWALKFIHNFAGLTELCFRLLATKCISRSWLYRGFGLAVHLSTAHSNSAIIVTI